MLLKHKVFVTFLILALVAVFIAGASSTLAQEETPTTPPSDCGWYGGMGMMSGGYGRGMISGNQVGTCSMHGEMTAAVAEALGIDTDTLATELQNGKSITELAEEHSVDIQTVYDATLAVMSDNLKAAVEAGYLTQEQADTQLSYMRENISQMPMFDAAGTGHFGFGPMHDDDWASHMNQMWGNHHGPMHGNGMGMMGHGGGMMHR